MFLKDLGTLSPNETMIYNYWLTTLTLMEMGIPWAAIQEFTPEEISLVLAVSIAKKETIEGNQMERQKLIGNRR